MNIRISVSQEDALELPLSEEFIKRVLFLVFETIQYPDSQKSASCSVVFVSQKHIQALNAQYRSRNVPTDVLAFPGTDEEGDFGDIFICPEYINALRLQCDGNLSDREYESMLTERIIHGFLHLLGYHHKHVDGWEKEEGDKAGKVMANITDDVLAKLFS